jgi:restriction system protein
MSIWLVRAGGHGEYERKFLEEKRVYVTWDRLNVDLAALPDRAALSATMAELYPDVKPRGIANWVSQVWPFARAIKVGDTVVLPLKTQAAIAVGEITGDYRFDAKGPNPFFHWRAVRWQAEAIPRTHFGKDILFSLGAFLTICRIHRNNAEARFEAMRANGWKPENALPASAPADAADESIEDSDLEDLARDQIAKLIAAKFKGHGLARLVDGILRAQKYTTYRSPEGADGGADILAGSGALGFGSPQLCVEVKSQDSPIDRPTVDKLLGAMSKFNAPHGLFVSWGGFKPNVQKELAQSFFKVRLWTQKELVEALFANYDALDDDLKAELPLKRIWTLASADEETP